MSTDKNKSMILSPNVTRSVRGTLMTFLSGSRVVESKSIGRYSIFGSSGLQVSRIGAMTVSPLVFAATSGSFFKVGIGLGTGVHSSSRAGMMSSEYFSQDDFLFSVELSTSGSFKEVSPSFSNSIGASTVEDAEVEVWVPHPAVA